MSSWLKTSCKKCGSQINYKRYWKNIPSLCQPCFFIQSDVNGAINYVYRTRDRLCEADMKTLGEIIALVEEYGEDRKELCKNIAKSRNVSGLLKSVLSDFRAEAKRSKKGYDRWNGVYSSKPYRG